MSSSFFDYFTKNRMDPSWAYRLIVAIPVGQTDNCNDS